MSYRYLLYLRRFLLAAISFFLLPPIVYGWLCLQRPPQTNLEQALFQGIVYKRIARSTPRPVMTHIVAIDLTSPGIKALVTPGVKTSHDGEIRAQTTSEFLTQFKLQLAINASYFLNFYEHAPWNYYPHSGDVVNPIGEAISNGYRYSQPEKYWSVLCISSTNRAQILESEKCPEGTKQGVAGNQLLVDRAQSAISDLGDDKPYPRVAVAVNREGTKLWLIAVDGKQPLYSEGVAIAELTKIILDLGAYTALNIDGGGSTTLVIARNQKPKVLNAPIHTRVPMRERPVANHLGFYALPIKQPLSPVERS
ncbi:MULTISPECIES: phosphodiester glycosidase family protein [Nostocales]|uniref:Periplasmic protein n=3 Tax=Nostocales TaxID=1161 RepID=A0A0C1N9U2_9CYAN|nr:phosphodiester glycosidase family protein [Tolypothrix bouteillei]KAF3886092.1 phosphodiester glycosidase family protein [Tolypothrix bouteillei VB521301]